MRIQSRGKQACHSALAIDLHVRSVSTECARVKRLKDMLALSVKKKHSAQVQRYALSDLRLCGFHEDDLSGAGFLSLACILMPAIRHIMLGLSVAWHGSKTGSAVGHSNIRK